MQSAGFEVQLAINGLEAIALSRTWNPHLIWMDLRMPEMDGLEATRQIKLHQPNIPIIALTAQAFAKDQIAATTAGCDGFILKPFHPSVLWECLAQQLSVQYVYTEDRTETNVAATDAALARKRGEGRSLHLTLTPDILQSLSQTWLQRLYKAALALDSVTLRQLMSELPESQLTLKQELEQIIRKFRYDLILQSLRDVGVMESNPPT